MTGQPKEPQQRSSEKPDVVINLGGLFVGIFLISLTLWSIINSQMEFAYLTVSLLSLLAIGNHTVNSIYS